MSTAQLIAEARQAGVRLILDGGHVKLRAATAPAAELIDLLRAHKPEIVEALRREQQTPSWTAADWRAYFDERAAIIEHDAGEPRTVSEARAWECCTVRWLDRHPAPSDPGSCAACKRAGDSGHVVVPFVAGTHGATWLHPECWPGWHAKRRARARAALLAMGIPVPRDRPPVTP